MANKIIIVQGGQYGSEAKGQIAGVICEREKVDIAVRTGATNAGHTYYKADPSYTGEGPLPMVAVKFQQLPVAAAIPGITCVLGAGALIDPLILEHECELASRLTGDDVRKRLIIDPRAGLHLPYHAERSAISGRHVKMGATGKGCSEALIDRIKARGDSDALHSQFGKSTFAAGYRLRDTEAFLNDSFDQGAKILLEGTQGQGLDLYLGPYPYTTHKQTGPAQWMLECGLSPALPTDIVMVVRTFPIRVAGNSGPMQHETSWPIMARRINNLRKHIGLEPLVADSAITAFEKALVDVAGSGKFAIPYHGAELQQYMWGTNQRANYAEALSNLNAEAMKRLPESTVSELKKLFEFTTVTKKLRRVALLSEDQLRESARQIRPHRLAITFMNYTFPEHWYEVPEDLSDDARRYCARIVDLCDTGIEYLGWGPESAHVVGPRDFDR